MKKFLLSFPFVYFAFLGIVAFASPHPHQKCLVLPIGATFQKDRNGVIAALTGFPAIEVPASFSTPTPDAPIGVPVGTEFLGRAWAEPELIRLAFGFEQGTHLRKPPVSTSALPVTQSILTNSPGGQQPINNQIVNVNSHAHDITKQ